MVAIGGWGDTAGFEIAAATDLTRKLFARNLRLMVDATGADGKLKLLNLEMLWLIFVVQVLISTGSTPG